MLGRWFAPLLLWVALIIALPSAGYAHSGHEHGTTASPNHTLAVPTSLAAAKMANDTGLQRVSIGFSEAITQNFDQQQLVIATVSATSQGHCAGCCGHGSCCNGAGSCCPQSLAPSSTSLNFTQTNAHQFAPHDEHIAGLSINGLERPPKA